MTSALILVHGIAMYSGVYESGLDRMADSPSFSVAVDLPGHGSNTDRDLDETFAHAAEVTATNGAEAAVVAGESMGCAHVARLSTAVLNRGLDIAGHILFAPPMQFDAWTLWTWSAQMLNPNQIGRLAKARIDLGVALRDLVRDPEWARRLLDDPMVKSEASFLYLLRSAIHTLRLGSELQRLKAPTLLIQGTRDLLMGRRNLELAADALGDIEKRVELVDGAGHSLFWDPKTDEVIQLVRDWLSTLDGWKHADEASRRPE